MNNMIINGNSVDAFQLGWSIERLEKVLNADNPTKEELDKHYTLTTKCMKFWLFKEQGTISQIMVFGGYDGKFLERIGVGSTLSELNNMGIRWGKEDYVYKLPDYRGICFELEDIEDWDELIAPIEFISIYYQ